MYNLRCDLPLLYDFYCVAKENSISAAAQKYVLSQSNLSRNIQNLEERLNLNLINRSNKGITLTADGKRLFLELDRMFSNVNFYKENNEEESIVIGTTRNIADYKLEKYLSSFHETFPKIHIKIITASATVLNEYLTKHQIDILLDYLPNINFSNDIDFHVEPFAEFKTCFACSSNFFAKYNKNINSLRDLNNYKLVIPGNSRRRQLLNETLQKNDVQLTPIIEMPDSKLMVDFVNNTESIGYFIEEEIETSNLKKLNINEILPCNSIGLIFNDKTNEVVKKFIKSVKENTK